MAAVAETGVLVLFSGNEAPVRPLKIGLGFSGWAMTIPLADMACRTSDPCLSELGLVVRIFDPGCDGLAVDFFFGVQKGVLLGQGGVTSLADFRVVVVGCVPVQELANHTGAHGIGVPAFFPVSVLTRVADSTSFRPEICF